MRKPLLSLLGLLAIQASTASAADVSVILSGEVRPGVYGQVEIGNSRPSVVYSRPIVISRQREYLRAAPIYLHVPPGHARHWSRHCAYYHSCGRPVYFIKSEEYRPRRYQDRHTHKSHRDRHDH